jgi:LmbE family N-acetylglucosaminyl deacetylase
VVVTFEPNGGYGHPDHIAIHHITVAAVAAAGDPDQYPEHMVEGLAPHTVAKFYYTALPKQMFRKMAAMLQAAGVDLKSIHGVRKDDMTEWGMADELITTTIDVSDVLDRKADSFWCHRTQLNPNGAFSRTLQLGGDIWREPMGTEYCIRVQPPFPAGGPLETDLFSGLD